MTTALIVIDVQQSFLHRPIWDRVSDPDIVATVNRQCCETTARVAADLGYRVTFVTGATATFPVTRPDTGETLPAADIIERTEFALAGRFADIATIDTAFAGPVDR